MGLKIVSGSAKGRKLKGPKKAGIRPAAARVRKSLFDILAPLEGMVVLDLYAGTGSMGMEALSRGAREATFVDNDPHAVSLLFENLKRTGFLDHCHILKKPALAAIPFLFRKGIRFDLIFVDPPYLQGQVDACLKKLTERPLLKNSGRIVCEHSPREKPTIFSGLVLADERKYGQTLVSIFEQS